VICPRLNLPVGDRARTRRRCPDNIRCRCQDEQVGIAWWNSLTRNQRRSCMARLEADEGHEAVTAERCWQRFGGGALGETVCNEPGPDDVWPCHLSLAHDGEHDHRRMD
jgi:hypothetical protein